MAITAAQVKELRDKTGAGMLDCKNALAASDGDIEKAIDWLREKGIAKSIKKASRIAAEGLAKIVIDGNKACMVEVNSETDFVAKNEQFLKLLADAANVILAAEPADNEAALALPVNGGTLNDEFINATATIGEKIVLRRFAIVKKNDDEIFGDYSHMGGSKTALVVLKGGDAELAHFMAMQVASMAPTYVSAADMPADVVDHERKVQTEIVKNDEKFAGKPEKVIEGAIEGKVSKALKEMCLVDQEYFMDTAKKVSAVLKENNAEVLRFVRYTVGEGIEKREENFAEEVAKQMNA
ncbi:MAG: elongation factor Ts [Erysipelotrichaceae bacterium]|nr:elongation factor Ts [Erysipelotrichaceae bacterium]MBQ2505909.1 elongation factor Ts [Erysipelotrichaceae bacterium]